jgi:uncharacterized protein YecT (DUF1311 family)
MAIEVMATESNQSCFDHADTQLQINQCSSMDNQTADQELNSVYQAVLTNHAKDKSFIDNFKQAQRAWLLIRPHEVLSGIFHWLVLEKAFNPFR